MRLAARPSLESLEAREVLSWGTYPPLTVTPPPSPQAVTLNAQGDASGQASIASGETDWYRFTARVTGSYVISAAGRTGGFDAVLGLYRTDGRLFGSNDNANAGTRNAQMTFYLQAGSS